jgi:xanthine dehydrogenase accessory factor
MSASPPGLVAVRGAGDLATGVILRLHRSGFPVLALETAVPTTIRRTVAFSEAVFDGAACVEDVTARRAATIERALAVIGDGEVPVLVDPRGECLPALAPRVLVDAIMAKRNLGTSPSMASIVIALGPGFTATVDAHAVIETNRGHALGRVILEGAAEPDTGVPGLIGGRGADRVVHASAAGVARGIARIGDVVRAGAPLLGLRDPATGVEVIETAPLDGMLRGLIRPGIMVRAGLKIADVDPRGKREYCLTVSDKALAVAGGVLEAILCLERRRRAP